MPGKKLGHADAKVRRARRVADVRRCRQRKARGAACYYVECDADTFDMMIKFGDLDPNKEDDRQAVATALGKLLRKGLAALLRENGARR
jgi:hypothetical protein